MALKLFNTLTRAVQDFVPLDPGGRKVGMYCCGPTVYDFGHIGNFRTFLFADLVRRHLEFRGYDVQHVMNITDVEDKIIDRVGKSGTTLREYTSRYETAFLEDMQALGCRRPHQLPRATEYIAEMILLIDALMKGGMAYRAPDGSVYFSIEKYQGCGCRYGQLVKLDFDQMRVGERVATDEYTKESLADFALWKARVPADGAVFWPSPWGEGRPGWHIECSAMSMKLLGPSFDLHLGGEDLAFPHHEDEIAQSEGATGRPFVKYWLHGAHLLVEGKKMSKSLGNFYTLRDLLGQGFNGREIRFLLLSAHYRESFNFTLDGLQGKRKALGRLDECLAKLNEAAGPAPTGQVSGARSELPLSVRNERGENSPNTIARREPLNHPLTRPSGTLSPTGGEGWGEGAGHGQGEGPSAPTTHTAPADAEVLQKFTAALDDDLNVSAAWGVVFDWVGETNRRLAQHQCSPAQAAAALATWQEMDRVFGLGRAGEAEAPPDVQALLDQRQAARAAKDFKRADALRDELKAKGWAIEDTPKGARLKRL